MTHQTNHLTQATLSYVAPALIQLIGRIFHLSQMEDLEKAAQDLIKFQINEKRSLAVVN